MVIEQPSIEEWYAAWPPDDTEESIMGSDWHQLTITNLRMGINEIARSEVASGEPVRFQAVSQATLLGLHRRGGTRFDPMPDVYIFKKPMDGHRLSFSLRSDGPPAVVIEVASTATFKSDTDFEGGKGWIYAAAGIAEYVTIDTSGVLQVPPLEPWRLGDDGYAECALDAEGIWWSEQVPVGLSVRSGMVVVYDRAHRAQLREGEIGAEFARRVAQAKQEGILRLLRGRFGALPSSIEAHVRALASEQELDALFDAALRARSLADVEELLP